MSNTLDTNLFYLYLSNSAVAFPSLKKFVDDTFDGSLPAFFAAFTQRKQLSEGEIAEIRRMIDSYTGE